MSEGAESMRLDKIRQLSLVAVYQGRKTAVPLRLNTRLPGGLMMMLERVIQALSATRTSATVTVRPHPTSDVPEADFVVLTDKQFNASV